MGFVGRRVVLAIVLAVVFALGCKKTPEEALKDWQTNEENLQKASAKYPAFKPALDDLLATAKKDFEAAKPDADKMHVAAARVGDAAKIFEPYEKEKDRFDKLMKDKDLADLPASKINPVMDAAKDAQKKSDAIMKESKPTNIGEAKAKIEEATKLLKTQADALEALKPKAAASAAPAASPAASGAAAKPAASAAPAKSAAPAASGKK